MTDKGSQSILPIAVVHVGSRQGARLVGAAIYKFATQSINSTSESRYVHSIRLLEFFDNDQYSNLDSLFNQLGKSTVYFSDEVLNRNSADTRRLKNILSGNQNIETIKISKSTFSKRPETLLWLTQNSPINAHVINHVEVNQPLAYSCFECLLFALRLKEEIDDNSQEESHKADFTIEYVALEQYMRLDSAAAEAVNLLPKPDHPNSFGSLFGVLNRCKTKGGSRLLEE
jgi:DNA mismatch repair protein MSH2